MSNYFNATKYERQTLRTRGTLETGAQGDVVTGEGDATTTTKNTSRMDVRVRDYVDGSDYLANNYNQKIGFYHVPSQTEVYFKAFLTAFNETYSPDWSEESVYGRADPIYMFKQTVRNITMGIKIPASTQGEGAENLLRVQKLVQFLYPAYGNVNSGTTITQSPLVRLSFQNLIRSYAGSTTNDRSNLGVPTIDHAASNGLLGVIKNLTINYNLEGDVGVFQRPGGTSIPKLIEINFDFGVIHEHALGWKNTSVTGQGTQAGAAETSTTTYTFSQAKFPYGMAAASPRTGADAVAEDLLSNNQAAGNNISAIEQQHMDATGEATSQQRLANEQARYMGLFGSMRESRDAREARQDMISNTPMPTTIEGPNQVLQRALGTDDQASYYEDVPDPFDIDSDYIDYDYGRDLGYGDIG
jgi:hypothetical protein